MSGGRPDRRVLDEQIDYYRARADEYDHWFFREGRYDRGADVTAAWFCEVDEVRLALACLALDGAHVLELAPGTGLWTELLAARAASVVAVEASEEMVARCRERLGPRSDHVTFHIADLFDWEPTERFDAVVFCFWISHVPDALIDGFLATVARALRPGGSVFFLDALREQASTASDHELPAEGDETMTRRLDDGREFTIVKNFHGADALAARCAAAGLDIEVHETATFFQYGVGAKVSGQPAAPA